MVEGRSKAAFKTWPAAQTEAFRTGVEVVATDGFTGFKTAAAEEIPDAVAVMDPFHVVRLAGDAPDRCRRRIQLQTHGHRGHAGDPLYASRRMLHTGAGLLSDKQIDRLTALFADYDHVQVQATWGVYQRMISAYRHEDRRHEDRRHEDRRHEDRRHKDRRHGRQLREKLIADLTAGVPKALVEVTTLGPTLKKRAADVSPTSTDPAHPTAPPKRSTADSNTSAAQSSDSGT